MLRGNKSVMVTAAAMALLAFSLGACIAVIGQGMAW